MLHSILVDQTTVGGDRAGSLVFVVIGDDAELVFLAADIETALGIDFRSDDLRRRLDGRPPWRAGAGQRSDDSDFQRRLGAGGCQRKTKQTGTPSAIAEANFFIRM